jgi:chromosome segregation ATPase
MTEMSKTARPLKVVQIATMEKQVGHLSGILRAKEAELRAVNGALQGQFEERSRLHGDVDLLQKQMAQLQSRCGTLEAALRESEAVRERLQGQQRCAPVLVVTLMATGTLDLSFAIP